MTFTVQNGGYPPGFLIGGPMINGIPAGGGDGSLGSPFSGAGFASSQALGGAGGFSSAVGSIGAAPQTFSSATFVPGSFGGGSFQSTLPSSGNIASLFGAPVGQASALQYAQTQMQFQQNLATQQMQQQQFAQQAALQQAQQQQFAQQAALQQTGLQQFPAQGALSTSAQPQQQGGAQMMQVMTMFLQMLMQLASKAKTA